MPYTFYTSTDDKPATITDQELEEIRQAHLPDDILGAEEDLQALVDARKPDPVPIKVTVHQINPQWVITGIQYG